MYEVETKCPCLAKLGGLSGMEATAAIKGETAKCPILEILPVLVVVESPTDENLGKAALKTGEFPNSCSLCGVVLEPQYFRNVTRPRGSG